MSRRFRRWCYRVLWKFFPRLDPELVLVGYVGPFDIAERTYLLNAYGGCVVCGDPRNSMLVSTASGLVFALVCTGDPSHGFDDVGPE